MAALDQMDVKEGVDQETVDAVREVGGAYKYGWDTEIEMEYAPKGVNPDIVGDGQLPENRFSGSILLRAPQIND